MLIGAICFMVFAVNHPECAFPWHHTITLVLYSVYIGVMILLGVILFLKPHK